MFNNTEEARKLVLDESKKWRQALDKGQNVKGWSQRGGGSNGHSNGYDGIRTGPYHGPSDGHKERARDSEGWTREGQ